MNKNYIKDNPDKAEAMFGTLIRGCAFVNDPKNKEEVMHVITKVMRNPDDIGAEMYNIEVAGGSIPSRCQITESAIKAYLESAIWSKSIAADTKIPPAKDIMFPEFYDRALAWYKNKGWMKK